MWIVSQSKQNQASSSCKDKKHCVYKVVYIRWHNYVFIMSSFYHDQNNHRIILRQITFMKRKIDEKN